MTSGLEQSLWSTAVDVEAHRRGVTIRDGEPGGSVERRVKQELARELHDRVAQTLTAMLVEMENLKGLEFQPETVLREVAAYQEATRQVLGNIRDILYELRGEKGIGQDFTARVRELLLAFEQKTGIGTTLTVGTAWPSRMATQAAINLYRVLEEALNNVRRHSGARRVRVSLQIMKGELAIMTIRDDGVGLPLLLSERMGLGLVGMRERALLLGGQLRVEPVQPRGTRVTTLIPKERLL